MASINQRAGEALADLVERTGRDPGADPAAVAFCLAPLAPRPELGHVDTEALPDADAPLPDVGSAR